MGVRALAVLFVSVLALACGAPLHGRSTAPLGSADPAAVRTLLARHAPGGHAIVTAYESLPTRFVLPEGPYTVSSGDTFDGYLGDGALELLVTRASTAVHEITHGYASRMAFQLLAERALPLGSGAKAILGDGASWLVRQTAVFPAAEIDATFPADARTFRYGVYIAPGRPGQATQVEGVYGLLDELAASYQDARVIVGLWPWVRDEAPADARILINYAVALDDLQRAHAELTLFVLHYLRHAREQRPAIYAALLANPELRGALLEVHDRYAALVALAAALEPEVHAVGRGRGVALSRSDQQLLIDGTPQRGEDASAMRAIHAHLAKDVYRAELAALRR